MDNRLRLFYRDSLRAARSAIEKDAEAFRDIIFTIEQLGRALSGNSGTLDKTRDALMGLASHSSLAQPSSKNERSAAGLFELVRRGRNEAFHEGAYARNLAAHAVELSLILEDALTLDAAANDTHEPRVCD